MNYPNAVAVDSGGNLFISDSYNQRIRRVDAVTQVITTVAGNGYASGNHSLGGFSGDGGPATAASLSHPAGIAVDSGGNLFIADSDNRRICRVDAASHVITTVAGNGSPGFGGDGGLATAASVDSPRGVALDSGGNIYFADTGNQRIRRVDATTQVITTVAGSGTPVLGGFGGDGGVATAASLSYPNGVAVDSSGNLIISDYSNHRIRSVDAASQIISTVAGNGYVSVNNGPGYFFYGDNGPATAASLNYPRGVAVDNDGNLFIADTGNSRIRALLQHGIVMVCPPNVTGTLGQAIELGTPTLTGGSSPTASNDAPSVFPLGTSVVTWTATDTKGYMAKCQQSVTLTYAFSGFFNPVSNPPTLNSVQAGSPIPVNFSLAGYWGLNVLVSGYSNAQQIVCSTGALLTSQVQTVSHSNNGLTYDFRTDRYRYLWQSNRAWAGTCWQLAVRLNDGTTHLANFKFK